MRDLEIYIRDLESSAVSSWLASHLDDIELRDDALGDRAVKGSINSGGAPGSGSGQGVVMAEMPQNLEGLVHQAIEPAALPEVPLTAPQFNNLMSDAPFCEECVKCRDGVCDV